MRKKTKLHLEASALEASNKGRELHEACWVKRVEITKHLGQWMLGNIHGD
jgi:hypothetical protein